MTGITTLFGESSRMKLVEFFMQFPKHEFTVPELVEGIGMSRTTVFNQIELLLLDEIIIISGKIGKSLTYTVNSENPLFKVMQKINSYRSKKSAISQLKRKNLQKFLNNQLIRHNNTNQQSFENKLIHGKTKISVTIDPYLLEWIQNKVKQNKITHTRNEIKNLLIDGIQVDNT